MKNKIAGAKKVKKLTLLDGWAVGTGAMIGVTIFVVSGKMSGLAGPAAALSFLIAASITVIIALCYSELSSLFPRSGGSYIYPKEVIGGKGGELLSFVSGWLFYGGQGLGPAAVALTLAQYLRWCVELLGGGAVMQDALLAVLLILAFGLINMVDTKFGNFLQLTSTFAVIAVLLVYIVWGGSHVNVSYYTPFMPNGFGPVLTAAAIGWAAFSGWSAIPNMSGDFRNPVRDVPRSMLSSLFTCGVSFGIIILIMNGLLPYTQLGMIDAPMAASFTTFSKYGSLLIAFGGIFAASSTLNGLLMAGSRSLYSMGREGDVPRVCAKQNRINDTPWVAVILTMLGMIVLAATGLIMTIMQMVAFVTVLSWIISCICLIVLRCKYKKVKAPFRTPLYPLTPVLAIALSVYMLTRLSLTAVLIGTGWLVTAFLVYFLFNKTSLKRFCNEKQGYESSLEKAGAGEGED